MEQDSIYTGQRHGADARDDTVGLVARRHGSCASPAMRWQRLQGLQDECERRRRRGVSRIQIRLQLGILMRGMGSVEEGRIFLGSCKRLSKATLLGY